MTEIQLEDGGFYWARTVGAPRSGDPPDGEMHQIFAETLDPEFDLELWDEASENDPTEGYAHYVLTSPVPELDSEGRRVWVYEYRPPVPRP